MDNYTPSDSTTIVHSVDVDFVRREIPTPIHIVQYDDSVPILAVSCYKNGNKWTSYPSDAVFSIRIGKPDGTFIYNTSVGVDTTDNSIVYFKITQQMTTIPGTIKAVIEVAINGDVAASSYVIFDIAYNPVQEGMVESTDEYTTVIASATQALGSATSAANSAITATNAATTATNAATTATTAATNASNSAEAASDSAEAALGSENSANDFAEAALESETNAKASETNAKTSETNAKASEDHIVELIKDIDTTYSVSFLTSNIFYDTDRAVKVLTTLTLEDDCYHIRNSETSSANAWINFPVCPVADLEDSEIYTASFLAITGKQGMAIQLGYCDRYGNNRVMGDNGPSNTSVNNRFQTTITIDKSEHADQYLCLWVYASWSSDNASCPHTINDLHTVTELQIEKHDRFTSYRPRGLSNVEIVPWNRKKYVALGDSITYGMIGRNIPGTGGQLSSFAKLTSEHYNMEFSNFGNSGYDVYITYSEGIQNDLDDDADIVTIMFGTNDVQTLSLDNFKLYYGKLLEAIYKKYYFDSDNEPRSNPAKIVVIIPPKILGQDASSIPQTSGGNGTLIDFKQYEQAIRDVASDYSFPVCDFYNESGLNPHINCTLSGHAKDESVTGYFNKFVTDGIHPSQEGHKILADRLIAFFKTLK